MANLEILRKKIDAKGLKFSYIAQCLGIEPNTFSRKINGSNDFKVGEVQIMQNVLNLSWEELQSIFFADNVHNNGTN